MISKLTVTVRVKAHLERKIKITKGRSQKIRQCDEKIGLINSRTTVQNVIAL
jgi:hypothetical protein